MEISEVLQENITSDNRNLVLNLVQHIDNRFVNDEDNFLAWYRQLISNLSKVTSVSGFLQVTRLPDLIL